MIYKFNVCICIDDLKPLLDEYNFIYIFLNNLQIYFLQIVTFTADHDNGYVADVTYEGEAQYPEVKPYEPAYGPPPPSYQ